MERSTLRLVLALFLAASSTFAAPLNFGDHPEYTAARRSLTDDVNAAIAGLKAAGAAEIVVVDGHGSGNGQEPDVFEAELLPPARMIERTRPFDIYMDSYDQSFDAIVAVAMHAGAEALPDTPAVQIRADDFENGYRRSLDLISMAGLALQLQAARAAIQAQPNAAAIQAKVDEIIMERWLQPPVPAPPAPPAPARRYYGAY